jgi:hypothetical protein
VGRWALWGLVTFLVVIYCANLFGQAPPNVTVLAWVGQTQWLMCHSGPICKLEQPMRLAFPAQTTPPACAKRHAGCNLCAGLQQQSSYGACMRELLRTSAS